MHVAASVAVPLASGSQQGIGAELPAIVALVVLMAAAIAVLASIFSPRRRRMGRRIAGLTVAGVVALYLVGRGIAEFWDVNYSDPASYEHSWGGPSLAGVFAVHSGPGFIIVIAAAGWLLRRRARNRRKISGHEVPGYPLDA